MQAPAHILAAIDDKNVILFDGVCNLCNGWVKFVLRFDRQRVFHFITAQSDLGESIFDDLGLKSDDYDTFIIIKDGQISTKLDGVFTLWSALGWPWKLLSVGRFLPQRIKDFSYHLVARNRYRLFGRRDICMIPTPETKARFLG